MNVQSSNIAIVGAGPAGCVAASLLAQAGFNVTLFEQHRFPRDKVCGECVSSLGVSVLRDIGALESIRALGAVELHRALVHSTDGSTLELPLPSPMLGVSRWSMDAALLDHARSRGATIRERSRCEGLSTAGDRPSIVVRDLERNVVETFAADHVILAEGKADWLRPNQRPLPSGDMGIKAHFRNVRGPRDAIELFSADGLYGGLAPIENDTWNIAFSIPARQLRRGDVAGEFSRVVEQNRTLRSRLRGATRVGEWFASPLPRFDVISSENWPARVIPIGNAVAAIEPIGGEGMGLAMRSAQLAADEILHAPGGGRALAGRTLERRFVRYWQRRARGCRIAAGIVSRPKLCNWLIGSLHATSSFSRIGLRLLGKA